MFETASAKEDTTCLPLIQRREPAKKERGDAGGIAFQPSATVCRSLGRRDALKLLQSVAVKSTEN